MDLIKPGTLWARTQATTRQALACGALQPINTQEVWIEEAGFSWLIHLAPSLARKANEAPRKESSGHDPFLDYEEDLFVGDISATHLCLLNKYNVFAHHILIVTRQFEAQETWLTEQDFAALAFCLQEIDGLAFYNSGKLAGASQPHKHLQLVPLPLAPGGPPLPVAPLWETAVYQQSIGHIPQLPFRHALAHLRRADAAALYQTYRALMRHLGLMPQAKPAGEVCLAPYNLLATRSHMQIVPRVQEDYRGIPVNALGFAGSLLARNKADLQILRQRGPLEVLSFVAAGD